MISVSDAAGISRAVGISVLPPKEDGSKAPLAEQTESGKWSWNRYQQEHASDQEFKQWYGRRTGLGWVCGAVSNGLEVLDFDDHGAYEAFRNAAIELGLGELVERIESGYLEESPSGGVHWPYYVPKVLGSTKLAKRPAPTEANPHGTKVLIETKGEGGYIIVAPSNGKVHPTGGKYRLVRGTIQTIAYLSCEERDQLWSLARTFDQMPRPEDQPRKPASPRPAGDELRPGDDFNARATWTDVLDGHGWKRLYTHGDTSYWRRPGKSEGWSATTNHNGSDLLWVFSTSTIFEAEKGYSKFAAFALLDHNGDFAAAAKALAQRGYGSPPKKTKREGGRNGKPPVADEDDREPPKRPEIEISTERHLAVDAAIAALRADPDLYHRGGALVGVSFEQDDEIRMAGGTRVRNVLGSPTIIELSESILGCRLTKFATFWKWKAAGRGEPEPVDCHPPDWLISSIATRKYWEGIRPLEAIVECPFPRPDGSIVDQSGYDKATATLYIPSIKFPPIPLKPNRQDAREAWERIAFHFKDFPFKTEEDRVIVLAGILTVIARPAIDGPVPGIAVIGNKAGTGKGFLINGMTIPGTGRVAPTSAYPYKPEEAVKVKVSIAVAARTVINFDNMEEGSTYGNGPLDSALTAMTVDDRVLGSSKLSGELPLRTTWFLSGNNISPAKDAYRRWLVCNLVTKLEHPEQRSDLGEEPFHDILMAHRGEIVRDALTILKAHAQGRRLGAGGAPLGSFEDWDRVVRRAVWYATGLDCLQTQRKTAEDSQDRKDKLSILEGWLELDLDGRGLTISEAFRRLEANPSMYATLRDVFLRMGRSGKPISSQALGVKFRAIKDNRINNMVLTTEKEEKGSALWTVKKLE
jgi:bifunctional DNA primase/polymerase-like protein